MNLTFAEIARAAGGAILAGRPDGRPARVVTDTRGMLPGDLFVALRGQRFDGHSFVSEAFQRGALGAVVSDRTTAEALRRRFAPARGAPTGAPPVKPRIVILVPDTLAALQRVAAHHRSRFAVPVVAVTGSNGKTTVKDMLARVLSARHRPLKSHGNQNNAIGVPLSLLRLRENHTCAVVEMGMNHAREIAFLAGLARPTVGVITNAGPAHLQFLKTVAAVARAKGELLAALPRSGTAVLNLDDPHFPVWRRMVRGRVVTFGFHPKAQVRAANVALDASGFASFTLVLPDRSAPVRLAVPGLHMVACALAAAAAAHALKMKGAAIAGAMQGLSGEGSMRMELTQHGGVTFLNDAYNANPASTAAALAALFAFQVRRSQRRVCVLGEMGEMGASARTAHADAGARFGALAAASEAGCVFIAVGSDLARVADEAARKAGPARLLSFCVGSVEAAVQEARRHLRPGDVLLVKGSREARLERVAAMLARTGQTRAGWTAGA